MKNLPTTGDRIKGTKKDGTSYAGVVDFIHPWGLHDRDRFGISADDPVIWLTNGQVVFPSAGDTWERVA